MQYKILYEQGKKCLQEAEIAESALDARLLLEEVCGTDRNVLFAHPELEVTAEKEEQFLACIEKRADHIPLQHILGKQEFMGLTFKVNEDVLVPRQDTEILVEEAMKYLHDGMRILDMCTGSGCILLSLLHYSNDCEGVGSDYSKAALSVAKENAVSLKETRASFVQGDLFENVQGTFDMIVSNPPYIATEQIENLMPEVRDHEPRMALDGTEDGLYFYKKITDQAGAFLCAGGYLLFEIGFDQGEAVSDLMTKAGYKDVTVVKDYAGQDRVVLGYKGGLYV